MRAKNIRVAYCQSAAGRDFTAQKKWDKDLESYASARKQGVQPEGTTRSKIEYAKRASNEIGVAYGTQEFRDKVIEKATERAS